MGRSGGTGNILGHQDNFVLTHHPHNLVIQGFAVVAYDMPPLESIMGGGISGVVYALDDFWVLKTASGFNLSHQELTIERRIYERLRSQRQILDFRSVPQGLILERFEGWGQKSLHTRLTNSSLDTRQTIFFALSIQ